MTRTLARGVPTESRRAVGLLSTLFRGELIQRGFEHLGEVTLIMTGIERLKRKNGSGDPYELYAGKVSRWVNNEQSEEKYA